MPEGKSTKTNGMRMRKIVANEIFPPNPSLQPIARPWRAPADFFVRHKTSIENNATGGVLMNISLRLRLLYVFPILIVPLCFALLYQYVIPHSVFNFVITGLISTFINLVCVMAAVLLYKDFFLKKYGGSSYAVIIFYHSTLLIPFFMLYFTICFCISTIYGTPLIG